MPDITKLWNPIYLFGPNPIDLSRSDHIFFWIAVGFVVAGLVAKLLSRTSPPASPRRGLSNRFFRLFATMGILVSMWIGLRFENIPWLGTHIVVLFLLLVFLIWLFFIGKYLIGGFRRQEHAWQEEQIKQKYLKR